jgi:D-lactate dehydrogenase (cytochrome)
MGDLAALPGLSRALRALADLLGDRLQTGQAVRDQHGANEAQFAAAPPDAVAYVRSTKEVSGVMAICARHGVPVTAHGAGSSLEGHHLAIRGGISLNMTGMDRVLEVAAEDMLAVVQPGVTREALNAELRATGLFFPVDPGANATLGGMAATRASGTTAVRYGTMRENVLALEAVLADGRVIRTGTRARKSSAGYDLTHLLVGSEGTLAIITEITLRLQGVPEAISAATCRFADVESAVNTVIATIQSGVPMARIEFIDAMMVRGFNRHSGSDLPEAPHLFVEFHGSPAGVAEQAASFGDIAGAFGAEGFRWADTPEARTALWKMRHNAHYAVRAIRPGYRALSTDVCVPISRLAEAIGAARAEADRLGLACAMLGHVGDGNFHCGVPVDMDDPADLARAMDFSAALARTALALGGTVTGEHGVGLGKRKYMRAEHGEAVEVMRALKSTLDPQGILNPGKLLPDPET